MRALGAVACGDSMVQKLDKHLLFAGGADREGVAGGAVAGGAARHQAVNPQPEPRNPQPYYTPTPKPLVDPSLLLVRVLLFTLAPRNED